jgi:hypothetical protein
LGGSRGADQRSRFELVNEKHLKPKGTTEMNKTESTMHALREIGADANLDAVNEFLANLGFATVGVDTLRTARKRVEEEEVADAAQAEAEDGDFGGDESMADASTREMEEYIEAEAQTDDAPESETTDEPEAGEPTTPREKTGYASLHPTGSVSNKDVRCGIETKSGPCIRPEGHPHGHMSAAVRDAKVANAKAKKEAARAAAAEANGDAATPAEETEAAESA